MTDVKELIDFDPLAHAEKLTGKSYKESEETSALGFLLAIDHNEKKKEVLKGNNDTHYSMDFNEYVEIAESEGFDVVYTEKRKVDFHDGVEVEETYLVLWQPVMGILLTVESYRGERVNSAKMYYNIDFGSEIPKNYYKVTSSGGFLQSDELDADGWKKALPIWAGDHDAREALRVKMRDLRSVNTLTKWKSRPFLWLCNYSQGRDEPISYQECNARVIAALPKYVQDAIAGEK